MKTVYLDVLVLENMLMNYVILHVTAKTSRYTVKSLRLALGAIVGTIYAVLALCVSNFFANFAIKIAFSALMIYASFWPKKIKEFLKISLYFYAITFLLAGVSLAALYAGNTNFVNNILITMCVGYLLVTTIAKNVQKYRRAQSISVDVYIQFEKNTERGVWLPAMVDTGNSLRDPFSGRPVIVAEMSALEKILPEEICDVIKTSTAGEILADSALFGERGQWSKRLRVIPYKAVGVENGMLAGFRADVVRIGGDGDERTKELSGVVICLYTEALSDNEEYKALLAPEMIA